MSKIVKDDVVAQVGKAAGVSRKVAHRVISQLLRTIGEELAKGNTVTMTGFGSWRTKVSAPRQGYDPNRGRVIQFPARTRVSFKPGAGLRKLAESKLAPEVFFGEGVSVSAEVGAVMARLFGLDHTTFRIEDAADELRKALGPAAAGQAEEFFAAMGRKNAPADEEAKPEDDS